jgi:hypothetical protein
VALETVAELANLFPTDIIDRSPTERALRLQMGHDLIFCAGHVQVPTNEDGGTDWAKVSRIWIIALEGRQWLSQHSNRIGSRSPARGRVDG